MSRTMALRCSGVLVVGAIWLAGAAAVRAQGCPTCGIPGGPPVMGCVPPVPVSTVPAAEGKPCCGSCWHCPKFYHCMEKPPCIKFKPVCSRPVCDPCSLEGYGYYPTCWRPYGPLNYTHCSSPAPALIPEPPPAPREAPRAQPPAEEETAPPPSKVPGKTGGDR